MKLLTTVSSLAEASKIAEQLKAHGIYTFISSEGLKNLDPTGMLTGTFNVGIWVIIDNQYNDAMMLLNNPDHQVVYQLTPEEIAFLDKQKDVYFSKLLNKTFNILAAILIGALLLCFIGYILYSVYR